MHRQNRSATLTCNGDGRHLNGWLEQSSANIREQRYAKWRSSSDRRHGGCDRAGIAASAQKKYDTGASDTEIKIGQTVPFSGPASAYAGIGKTQAAYFKMINDQGGINGRKLNLIQYDDAYSPPKAVEQVRKLVESDEVLFTFQIIGTPSNAAVQKYLNTRKVPQLLAATGASKFTDPKNFPWTMGYNPNYQSEGRIYAKYILQNHPNARIGILYQNDDLGRDYITGLKEGLGAKAASMIVAETSYELTIRPSICRSSN